ncbi:glycosyltransferase family 2 protein [soil metagenome]
MAMGPKIAVLLATRNGRRWLPEQVATILDQEGVQVRIIALDDVSTDGTDTWLDELAAVDPRVRRLPTENASGSSAANFFRLIDRAPVEPDELVAFADQDDVWKPGKLARHARLILEDGVDGVSSNVTAFSENGSRTLVMKSHPQRRFDYLLQSPGPGSTFLISHDLFELVRRCVREHPEIAARIDYHDSYMYVVARSAERRWFIDPQPTVDYRQHDSNVIGANVGARSAFARLDLIREHWHRQQAIAMTELALTIASEPLRSELEELLRMFSSRSISTRLALARGAWQFRRRPRDRFIIAALILAGVW